MDISAEGKELSDRYVMAGDHDRSDYFALIRELVERRGRAQPGGEDERAWQAEIDTAYELVADELRTRSGPPRTPVTFGTSGWRGIIGKDLFLNSVGQVTLAVAEMYEALAGTPELSEPLGVSDLETARRRGCVVGFDSRFGGEMMARRVVEVLTARGFKVYYAGESTTGALSAAVLVVNAAFSINLTPSHNPLEYAGFKFNAADAGPAAAVLTDRITDQARGIIEAGRLPACRENPSLVQPLAALGCWRELVRNNRDRHGLDYDRIIADFAGNDRVAVAVDCVHGAGRQHIRPLFGNLETDRLVLLRADADPTFGGIAPEPSSENMLPVRETLRRRREPLRVGVVIDPDGDRVRFTDGEIEINMNRFGAMAYHYLHEHKHRKGPVAKTVATSNFANAIAAAFGEEVFEPRVGFKEFKPVVGRALVCFEESDGISIIGHTPEKDAYIGLLLALDMVMSTGRNLGEYLAGMENSFGRFYPDKDGVTVSLRGEPLLAALEGLNGYEPGTVVTVADRPLTIREVITIDGRKMIFEDESWLMIRPSGTEPKVRFYVEGRSEASKAGLFEAARRMLGEIGLL